jgi:hypothetical protein
MFFAFKKNINFWRKWIEVGVILGFLIAIGAASFGVIPWIFVFAKGMIVALGVLIRIFGGYRTKKGVWISRSGVIVRDSVLELFFPWAQLNRHKPAALSGGDRLVLRLASDRPGLGYVVKRAKIGNDFANIPSEESVIDLDGLECTILSSFQGGVRDLVRKIELGRREYLAHIEKDLPPPQLGEYAIALGGVVKEKKQVVLREGVPIRFPQFCPFTGDDCDQVMMIHDWRHRFEVPWLVSSKAVRQRQQVYRIQLASLLVPLIFYILYGYWVIFWMRPRFESDAEIIWHGLYALSLFLITPLVRMGKRSPLRVEKEKQDLYSAFFQEDDYLRAFVELNQEK